jgi:hypothetical protein
MLGPEEDEDFTTEYARFALNSRGIPEDFDTWVTEMRGSAKRKPKTKKKTKKMRDDGSY